MAFLDETGLAELWSLVKAEDAKKVQMVTGSYTGTGTKTKSLTFDFVPKFVLVHYTGGDRASGYNPSQFGIYPSLNRNGGVCMAGFRYDMQQTAMQTTLSGTTLSWTDTTYGEDYDPDSDEYYERGDCALNGRANKYNYIVLG